MSKALNSYTPPAALTGSMRDYRFPRGADLQDRVEGFFKWQNLRRQHGLWPFSRSTEDGPSTVCTARDDAGGRLHGVNFASQDYISMSSHPAIKQVAKDVIEEFGVHSAGSAALVGNTSHSVLLERKIAEFLGMEEAILFPTGWAAGYGVIKGLVYAPFARYASEVHGLDAVVHRHLSPAGILDLLDEGRQVMASVHYGIRHPERPAPGRGGHLVLLTSRTADGAGVHFHNPSGISAATRTADLPLPVFERFFAGRGVSLPGLPAAGVRPLTGAE